MKTHVCPIAGCPNLAPCPTHSRPANAPWSNGRDMKQQYHFRKQVLAAAGHRCARCGTPHQLVAHHLTPTQGVALCVPCHRIVDHHAR